MADLTPGEMTLILQALDFTKAHFESYEYPTREIRDGRLAEVDHAIQSVRAIRREMRERNNA